MKKEPDYEAMLAEIGITDPDEQKKVLDFLRTLCTIAVNVAMKKEETGNTNLR